MRILVVDDSADIRRLVVEVLRAEGLDGEEAATGVAALDRLAADPLPDLVVLDVQMPALDGWDTLRRIRSDPRTAAVAVVLCTVKAGARDAALAAELGCDAYVNKPFAIDALADEIHEVLRLPPDERLARRERNRAADTHTV